MKKVCLVLEGGSMRGMFSAGVLDTFMDENIKVDCIIGVSAGALFGPNYFSNQKGRALRYNKRYCKDLRFISMPSFLLTGNIVNKQFAFYDVTYKYDVFDNETYVKNNTGYLVTVTNIETGKAEYLPLNDVYTGLEILRASSALPFFSKIVEIDGKKYLDGGIADSIPVLKAKELGYDKIIVITTRPEGYRKEPLSPLMLKVIQSKYKKYPAFVETMASRATCYNETLDMIKTMEDHNEIFVIRPTEPIHLGTIERDADNLQNVHDLGVKVCKERLEALKEYLNDH